MIRYLKASGQTFAELREDLVAIDTKYANKATREMRVQTESLRHIRLLIVTDNESWIETDEMAPQFE